MSDANLEQNNPTLPVNPVGFVEPSEWTRFVSQVCVKCSIGPFRLWILAPEVCLYKPMARIRSFLGVGQALGYPSPLSALPQAMNVIRSTSIDFAENQLYPILVIRIGKPGRAFPPMEPHVQVSSHTAQMTNGKSRPLAGPKLLVPAFPG